MSERLEREIATEKVSALRRIAETLELLLEQLAALHQQVAEAPREERPERVATYNATRRLAARYRWYLEVQRDALGFRRHEHLDDHYRVPPEL
jgi:hypothetical protein